MIIQEVEVRNMLGCSSLYLEFNMKNFCPVYVVQNNDNPKTQHLLTMAVQLICSAKYAHTSLFDVQMLESVQAGTVRIKFILPTTPSHSLPDGKDNDELLSDVLDEIDFGPSTSHASRQRLIALQNRQKKGTIQQRRVEELMQNFMLINVIRDFRNNPNGVTFSINNGPQEKSCLAAFHGRFYICLDYMLPQLKNLLHDFNGKWLELLTLDLNQKWNKREQTGDPFERFMQLYHKYGFPDHMSDITRACLSNNNAKETLQKTYIIKILRDIRGIFEFILADEFTVWFYVPHYGRNADIVDVEVEDINFEQMTTYIQDKSTTVNSKYIWNDARVAIKDMLLIAFQIALSFHCKQKIIYLSNFDEISKYQSIQFATTAFFTKLGIEDKIWSSKNYLQRIIDVCIKSGSTAIIEYPGGTPIHPKNAYLMKSFVYKEGDKTSLSLKIINGEKYSFKYFLECLENDLNTTST